MVQLYADRSVKQELEKANKIKEEEIKEYSTKIETLENEKVECAEKLKTLESEKEESVKQIKEFTEKVEDLEKSNEELVKFKEGIEEQEKQNKIKFAINSVKDTLNEKQVKEWEAKVTEFESVDAFVNAIQAYAYTQVKDVPQNNEINKIHIPQVQKNESKKGLWD
jgi:chromosome segregation ATPase